MFVRNAWYPAIWSNELGADMVARRFLDEPVVLFRSHTGEAAALEDRCCHRGAALSRGEKIGDLIQCGYHGLKFDMSGRCVEIPNQQSIPPSARVRRYPVRDKWNMLWIWMGDPELADEASIPGLYWMKDPGWTASGGYIYLNAGYRLLLDNLMDVTHVAYVHRKTLAGDPKERTTPTRTERIENGVRVGRWILDVKPPPMYANAGAFVGNVDRWQFTNWTPPTTVYLDVGCAKVGTGAPQGDRSQGVSFWSTHIIAPETATSTHYFFNYARNFKLDDAELSQRLYEGARATFLEDVDLLERQQENLRGAAREKFINIACDAAQLQVRRMLDRLIEAEAERA